MSYAFDKGLPDVDVRYAHAPSSIVGYSLENVVVHFADGWWDHHHAFEILDAVRARGFRTQGEPYS
jgi:hypothetical protein